MNLISVVHKDKIENVDKHSFNTYFSTASFLKASAILVLFRWYMPFNVFLTFLFGATLGWIIVKIMKPPKHLSGIIIANCCAGKSSWFIYSKKYHSFFYIKSHTVVYVLNLKNTFLSKFGKYQRNGICG